MVTGKSRASSKAAKPEEDPQNEEQLSEQAEVVEQETSAVDEEEQISQALARQTDDGPGDEPVPPSDFESYATAGVEKERRPLVQVVQEVLDGVWGDYSVRRGRLTDAGYNATEVQSLVNMRLAAGAPSAHHASAEELLAQVDRGEWGASPEDARRNLDKAGYVVSMIKAEADRSRGE
jgi:hypothetical protein